MINAASVLVLGIFFLYVVAPLTLIGIIVWMFRMGGVRSTGRPDPSNSHPPQRYMPGSGHD